MCLFLNNYENRCNHFEDIKDCSSEVYLGAKGDFLISPRCKVSNIQNEACPLDTEKQLFTSNYVTGL